MVLLKKEAAREIRREETYIEENGGKINVILKKKGKRRNIKFKREGENKHQVEEG